MNEHNQTTTHCIGVISDTHGHLSRSAIQALKGVSLILHAGDLNTQEIYHQLQKIAPLKAVRGNMDGGAFSNSLPITAIVQIGKANILIIHDLYDLDIKPSTADIDAVIYGHTHQPKISKQEGVLYINPGSASSPRHGGTPSLIKLKIRGKEIETELIDLSNS